MLLIVGLEETLLGDLKRFQEQFIALRSALWADGVDDGVPFHSKDLLLLSERIIEEGTSFVYSTLPLLGRALDNGLVTGSVQTPSNFRLKGKTALPVLFYSCFSRVFEDSGSIRSNPCVTTIFYLRQMLLLDSKFITEPTKEQQQSAYRSFCDRQNSLRKVRLPIGHPVIEIAKRLLTKYLKRLDISSIQPGHGPGAVAEGFNRFEKWDFRNWPAKAERFYPFLEYGTPSLLASLSRGSAIPLVRNLTTKCCLVPKDFRGPRLISAESTATQYLQQGQMRAIMRYIENHPVLSKSIRLRDQTHNRKMCKTAYDNGLATLDLSNASDTVSCVLVWELLSGLPKLRRYLFSTRSDWISFEGKRQKIIAFSPMGSAVCFPIETLVFWSLTMASLKLVRPQYRGNRASFKSEACSIPDTVLASEVAVFGDDIIVPEEALPILTQTLSDIGCEPNMSKTCWRTPFRESCGSEWYKQSDVAIIRNRRLSYDVRNHISSVPVICDLQRKFFLKGLWKTANLLSAWVHNIYPVPELSIFHFTEPLGIPASGFSAEACGPVEPRYGESYWSRVPDRKCDSHHTITEDNGLFRDEGTNEVGKPPTEGFLRLFIKRKSSDDRCFRYIDSLVCTIGVYDAYSHLCPDRYNRYLHRREIRVPRVFLRTRNWTEGNYARLLARLVGDNVERIAIRTNYLVKMAWSCFPTNLGFHQRYVD